MTLEQILMALQDRRLSVIAKATGLSVQTLRRFRDGKAMRPAHDTMQRLTAYLEGRG